ncbi:putative eka-like protein [Erysiphe necator]|uniref:Putative eka-like protein n=1 Tax=Uncinula necator TaxID=52586 RepID=A0A0B1PBQ5_UNCNE|nr:putative eka-like protein [Erysiphe necator]
MSVPQELQEIIETEIRQAAQAKANIQICITAVNVVEDSLSLMLTGGYKSIEDSLRVFLRASIGQSIQVGPGAATSIVTGTDPAFSRGPLQREAGPILKSNHQFINHHQTTDRFSLVQRSLQQFELPSTYCGILVAIANLLCFHDNFSGQE